MKTLLVLNAAVMMFLSAASAHAFGDGYPPFTIKYPGETCQHAGEGYCYGQFRRDEAKFNACVADVPRKCRLAGYRD